jgi:CRP/FNR family transcriptional regulator
MNDGCGAVPQIRRPEPVRLEAAWPPAKRLRIAHVPAPVPIGRESFVERLKAEVRDAEVCGGRFALLMVQLEASRHGVPERAPPGLWRALARQIRGSLRPGDAMAPMRANECAVLLKNAESAAPVLPAWRSACRRPVEDEHGVPWRLRFAAGLSVYPDHGADAIELLRKAGSEAANAGPGPADVAAPGAEAQHVPPQQPSRAAERTGDVERLLLLADARRRVVRADEFIYRAGDPFQDVHLLRVGLCKLTMVSVNGHEELASLLFKGDWLGIDGLDIGQQRYTAQAIDVGELWSARYDAVIRVAAGEPDLLKTLHCGMVRQASRDRDAMLMQHVLPADGKVADFLARWAQDLERSGMRADRCVLPITRAEIGAHLGLRIESVSRAISRLEREGLIVFGERGRRDLLISQPEALREFVQAVEREG